MILTYQDTELREIEFQDMSLVRSWRNSEHVRNSMKYKEYISEEMQVEWFDSVGGNDNLYFLIVEGGEKIGVVNLKNIDLAKRSAEAGIFIGESEYLGTLSPVIATCVIMRFGFDVLGLEVLKAVVSTGNVNAILFNQGLGYVKVTSDGKGFDEYQCLKHSFLKADKRLRVDNRHRIGVLLDENWDWLRDTIGDLTDEFQLVSQ